MEADDVRQFVEQGVPFNGLLGLRAEVIETGRAQVRMPFREALLGDVFRPALHGGAVAALIDATAGAAAYVAATESDRIATLDLRIDYLRPAPKCDLVATAEVRRMGNRVAVVNVEVVADGGERELVAEGRAVFSVWRDVA